MFDEEEKSLSDREQRSLTQDTIRKELREIVHTLDGRWLNAEALTLLVKEKHPELVQFITPKSVAEYLKSMRLQRKYVASTLYLCIRQFGR